jgi:hypothetical protein
MIEYLSQRKEACRVQPKDQRNADSSNLSGGKELRRAHDQMGQSGHRAGAARKRRRPRNKRKKF